MHAEDQALSFSRPPALGVKARSWKRDHQELQSPTLQRAKIKENQNFFLKKMLMRVGLEPTQLSLLAPEASALTARPSHQNCL
jgi:hypothetical protein